MAVMAGRAADRGFAGEEFLVQVRHHLHHLAGGLLRVFVVARVIAHDVAVGALHAKRCRHVLHHELKLVLRNVLQYLNVAQLKSTTPTAGSRRTLRRWPTLRRLSALRGRRLLRRYTGASCDRQHQRRGQDRHRKSTEVTCDHANPPPEEHVIRYEYAVFLQRVTSAQKLIYRGEPHRTSLDVELTNVSHVVSANPVADSFRIGRLLWIRQFPALRKPCTVPVQRWKSVF